MKKLAQLLFIAAIAYANSAFCQKTYYYLDSLRVPADPYASNTTRIIRFYFSGFIVNLNGDTVSGKLRKTESFGGALMNYLTSGVQSIDFIPNTGAKKVQILLPKDIRAFGFASTVKSFGVTSTVVQMSPVQQMIELIPHDNDNLLGWNIGHKYRTSAYWNYESKKVDGLNGFVFLQRLVFGKLIAYDDNMGNSYVAKIEDQNKLFKVDDNLLDTLFNGSKQVTAAMQKYPGFINFERALGIYNLEADGNSIFLNTGASYIVLNNGDEVDEKFQIEGIFSNLALGMVHKIKVYKKEEQDIEYDGADIKRIVLHLYDSTYIYDAYKLDNRERYFYRLIIDGKVKLYFNPRRGISPSYLIIKDAPVLIRPGNYDEIAGQIFGDSANWVNMMKSDPSKNNFKNMRENVIFYNAQVNKN